MNSHFLLPKNSHSSFCLSPPKIVLWLITETETIDRMYSCSVLLPIDIRNQNNTKNYWKYEKKIVREGVRGKNRTCENLQIAKHTSERRLFRFYPQQMNSTCASLKLNFPKLFLAGVKKLDSWQVSVSGANSACNQDWWEGDGGRGEGGGEGMVNKSSHGEVIAKRTRSFASIRIWMSWSSWWRSSTRARLSFSLKDENGRKRGKGARMKEGTHENSPQFPRLINEKVKFKSVR